ncbi:unnamed protein product, partial [Staurois parvus]
TKQYSGADRGEICIFYIQVSPPLVIPRRHPVIDSETPIVGRDLCTRSRSCDH